MPMSTAETVTRASSPGARPVTEIGIAIGWRGLAIAGAVKAMSSLWASRPMANHATPTARPGMRFALTSSGRWVSATA